MSDTSSTARPTAPAATLVADGRLSEDYLLTRDILLDLSSRSPLAVARGDGRATALAIVQDAGLNQVVRDSSSASGWSLAPLPSGAVAREVVAALDAAGTLHAFYADETSTYHSSLGSDGAWTDPDAFGAATGLGISTVPLSGSLVAYGLTADGNLLLASQDGKGAWTGATVDFGKALLGAQVVMQMTGAASWEMAATSCGTLQFYTGIGGAVAAGPMTVSTPAPVARVHFVYRHRNSSMYLFSDNKNVLYSSVGFGDQVAAVAQLTVAQAAGIVGNDLKIRLYCVAPDGKLWVLHQTRWDATTHAPVWAPIFPLDTDVAWVAAPLSPQSGSALFAAGADGALHALLQDPATQLWRREVVQGPESDTPYRLTRFRSQVSVFDSNGTPAGGVPVTVTASRETALFAGGSTWFVGPGDGQSATLKTDATGVLAFSMPAESLEAPLLTFAAPGARSITSNPADAVHAAMAGTAPLDTGLAVVPPMSKIALKSAVVPALGARSAAQGKALAPGVSDDLAETASQGIISAMQIKPGGDTSAAFSIGTAAAGGWALDLRDPAKPVFTRFSGAGELQAHLTSLSTKRLSASGLGSVWDDIGQFAGDVWHAIKRGAMDVVQFVVDAANAVAHLVVKVGDEIAHLAALAVKGLNEVVSVVHAIFNAIGAAIGNVLDWLKDLFGWDDIWRTKEVIEHMLTQAIPALQYLVGQKAVVAEDGFFKGLKETVDGGFQRAEAFLAGQSIGQMAKGGGASAAPRSGRLLAAAAPGGSAAQHGWMMSKARDHVPGSSALGALPSPLSTNLFDELEATLASSGLLKDWESALAALEDFFQTLVKNPSDLPARGAADLVKAAQSFVDFVIDLMDTLTAMLLEIVSAAVGAMGEAIEHPLGHIPVVSWLYRNVVCPTDQQEDLSIVRLCALLMAFPVTLIYKAAQGKAPFSGEDVLRVKAWSFQPPSTPVRAAAPSPSPSPVMAADGSVATAAAVPAMAIANGGGFPIGGDTLNFILIYLSPLQACVDMASDGFSQGDDGNSTEARVAGWLDLLVTTLNQVLSWPGGRVFDFKWQDEGLTHAQWLRRGAWIVAWVPLLVNAGLLLIPSPREGIIAKAWDPGGKILLCVLGGLTLGVGLAGSIWGVEETPATANGYNVADSVLAPMPNLGQFLRINSLVEGSEGATLVIKLLLNDIADVASAFLSTPGMP